MTRQSGGQTTREVGQRVSKLSQLRHRWKRQYLNRLRWRSLVAGRLRCAHMWGCAYGRSTGLATEPRKGSCYKVCFPTLDKLSAPVSLPITTAVRMTKALTRAAIGPSPLAPAALKGPGH